MGCPSTNILARIRWGGFIRWKHFPRYWPFVRGIHRSPVSNIIDSRYIVVEYVTILNTIFIWVVWRKATTRYRRLHCTSQRYLYGHVNFGPFVYSLCNNVVLVLLYISTLSTVPRVVFHQPASNTPSKRYMPITADYLPSRSGVGVTKAPFVNFSVSKIFDLAKVPVIFFESLSYLTGITAAQLRRYLSNINVIFNI